MTRSHSRAASEAGMLDCEGSSGSLKPSSCLARVVEMCCGSESMFTAFHCIGMKASGDEVDGSLLEPGVMWGDQL